MLLLVVLDSSWLPTQQFPQNAEITTWTAPSSLLVEIATPLTAGCWFIARNLVKSESAPNLPALSRLWEFEGKRISHAT